jgi:hypothetical protein
MKRIPFMINSIYESFEVFAAVPSRIQISVDVTVHRRVLPDVSNERVA